MGVEAVFNWLRGGVPAADQHDQDIARQAYVDFLDAQLEGFATPVAEELRRVLHGQDGVVGSGAAGPADFATIMGVETRLAGSLSDEDVRRTYWIVRDRFMRVASLAAIAEHDRWAPPDLRPPSQSVAITPLTQATAAEAAAMQAAGRTAVELATAVAAVEQAGPHTTKEQEDARSAAQEAHLSALTAAAAARKRWEELQAQEKEPGESVSGTGAA